MSKITPCLWFDGVAEEAARFYVGLLPDSRVEDIARSPSDWPGGRRGDAISVTFIMGGQRFVGLNGGPQFRFNEAVSFQIHCDDQAEVDRLSDALSADPAAERCGWVKDRYGLSWQIVPRRLPDLLADPDPVRAQRVMAAMLEMRRIDIAALEEAARGDDPGPDAPWWQRRSAG